MTTNTSIRTVEDAVLTVLTGTPLDQAAARVGMAPTDLADAIETYRSGGRAALDTHDRERDWHQVRIRFTDWDAAEHVAATHLGPRLHQAHKDGALGDWWFIRKHPCWRLRCRPGPETTKSSMKITLGGILDDLVATEAAERWWESIYEPEIPTFGGSRGMETAHSLFHADSSNILTYLAHHEPVTLSENTVGRRELSVLLCSTLLRYARLDGPEQSDVWYRVEQARPLSADTPLDRVHGMIPALQRLTTMDTTPTSALFDTGGPLTFAASWAAAFAQAGHELADAARDGVLERGLRAVLASHVVFHWNRLGLPTRTQAILARAAREALANPLEQ